MGLKHITSLDIAYDYLYTAMQLEHATIPTYLTTLYSIHPGTNVDATQVIRVVAVEEMLHLTLAANIMNAIGGTVDLTKPGFLPSFPTYLPDGETDFQVDLQKFSKDALKTFLSIERPAETRPQDLVETGHGLVKREDEKARLLPSQKFEDEDLHFYSIGEFYKAIQDGLEHLCEELGEDTVFSGDPAKQVTSEYYYSGGGEIIPVVDLASAKQAIELISEQGEGYEGSIIDFESEISHYYRFDQLVQGRYYVPGDKAGEPTGDPIDVDWDAVYPIRKNLRVADLPEGSELRAAAENFNAEYKNFLKDLTVAFSGQPGDLIKAVGTMFHVKDKMVELMRVPIPGTNENAAPTFEVD
jgi:hypothetical protein